MKKIMFLLLVLCINANTHAQFGAFSSIYNATKSIKKNKKSKNNADDDWRNKKIKELHKAYAIDTASIEYKQLVAEGEKKFYEQYPEMKNLMELKDDTVSIKNYFNEHYSGMSAEEIAKKMANGEDFIDKNSKEYKEAYEAAQKASTLYDDPIFKRIMEEKRHPTMEEAMYFKEKYGLNYEFNGIEAYNDSIGVYAHIDGKMKIMNVTKCDEITSDRPIPDIGQDRIKSYINDYISVMKNPFADRTIVDSSQVYMIFKHRHAEEQFREKAHFTLYSNTMGDQSEYTFNDYDLRKIGDFSEPIDPKNIVVFKVHKGIGCRYMEYMNYKMSYKESEMTDFITKSLIEDGYIDASINQKISDDEFFKAIIIREALFKLNKLHEMYKNKEQIAFANIVSSTKDAKVTFNTRKVGVYVTALDVTVDAKPGEYALIIRKPQVEEELKKVGVAYNGLEAGAFFFSIK